MKNKIERKTLLTVFGAIMGILVLLWMIGLVINPTGVQFREVFCSGGNMLFCDFLLVLNWIADRNPYSDFAYSIYLPLCYLLLYPFACLNDYSSMTLSDAQASEIGILSALFFVVISLALLYFSLYKLGKSRKSTLLILGLLFFSPSSLLAVERGNLIILTAALVAAFLFLYNSPKKEYRGLALVCLSVATVFKIYPALFGLLFLWNKKYKSIGFCIILGLLLTFLPFLFFYPGFFESITQLISNMSSFANGIGTYGLPPLAHRIVTMRGSELPYILIDIAKYSQFLLAAISIILCFFTKNNWLRIAISSVIVIALPAVSYTYCGLYFFPVIVLFFNKQVYTKIDWMYVFLFCVFLSPFQLNIRSPHVISNMALLAIWGLLLLELFKEVRPQRYLYKVFNK